MAEKTKYIFDQYVYGRFSSGYDAKSTQGSRVPGWLQGDTRETKVSRELPTLELQSSPDAERMESAFVLSNSVYVDYAENRDESGTRNFSFSQSLLLQNAAQAQSFRECASDMLKILACSDCFWTSQTIREWGDESLPEVEIEGENVRKEWVRLSGQLGRKEMMLSRDSLALFLARYWEVCSQRAQKGKPDAPLLLVVTPPERNYETEGRAVVPDGIRFFVEDVLPHLPEEILPILSVSFGCLGGQVNAQKGTACMVCYPTSDTLEESSLSVYLAYEDAVYDDQVNSTVLKIGQMMLDGHLPSYYRRLSELDESKQNVRDFELFYNEVAMEELLNEAADSENVSEEDHQLDLEEIDRQRMNIIETLRSNRYSESEITYILFELEKKYLESCEQLRAYDKTLYESWLNGLLSLPSRVSMLSAQEAEELRRHYHNLMTRQSHWQAVEQIMEYCEKETLEDNEKNAAVDLAKEVLVSAEKKKRAPRNVDEAIAEWDIRVNMAENLQVRLGIPVTEITQLLGENELRVLEWYDKSGLGYNAPLFERILHGVETLDTRADPRDENTSELREAYKDCLTHRYLSGVSKENSPLLTVLSLYPDLENYPEQLMPYEDGICQTAGYMTDAPCEISQLMERMLGHQIRAGQKAEALTRTYEELIAHFVPDETAQLKTWLSVEERYLDNEKAWPFLSEHLLYYLRKHPVDQALGDLLDPVVDHYEKLRSAPGQKELENILVGYTCSQLEECIRKGEGIDALVGLIRRASLPINENTEFYHLLMKEVQEEGLEAFTNTNLMNGIMAYHDALGRKTNNSSMGDAIISCAQNKHERGGLDFQDLDLMLHVCRDLGIEPQKQKEAYANVFEDAKWETMPTETEEAFRAFLAMNPLKNENIAEDSLTTAMINWAGADPENLLKNLSLVLTFAEGYLGKLRNSRKQFGVRLLNTYLDKLPEREMPSIELIRKILEMLGNQELELDGCEKLCQFYQQHSEEEELYEQMWEIATKLSFQSEKIDQNKTIWQAAQTKEKWVRCFLHKTTGLLSSIIQGKKPEELLVQAQKPDGLFRTWNVLYDLAEDKENINVKGQSMQSVKDACGKSFDRASKMVQNDILPLARKMKDAGEEDQETGFQTAFLYAFKKQLRAIMEDEKLFRETVKDKENLESVRYCWRKEFFEPITEDIQQRGDALKMAFSLIDMYDNHEKSMLLRQLPDILGKIRKTQPAFEAFQEICLKSSEEKTKEWDYPEKDIPKLIYHCQLLPNDPTFRFDWMGFLNDAHPRTDGRKWEQADILSDSDNTYGTVAALMNWFSSVQEAKPFLDSFQRFLDQSSIGKKVRARRKAIERYYDTRTDNPLIHWILGRQGTEKEKQ